MSRVFSDDELAEARKTTGKSLKTAGGKPYFPKRYKPEVPHAVTPPPEKPKDTPISPEIVSAILTVAKSNEANMAAVLANQEAMISVVHEMNRPKPKKKWHCPISRNLQGEMTAVDIEEL